MKPIVVTPVKFAAQHKQSKGAARRAVPTLLWMAAMLAAVVTAHAQSNLIPNPDFNDVTNPLKEWRIEFPYQETYIKNPGYISISKDKKSGSANVVEITEPKAVAENEGAKIESAFVKAQPGATYHASIDCMTNDLSAKCYIQVWAIDPSESTQADLYRVPARNGMPALVMVGRSEFEPPGTSKVWTTIKKDYKVPEKVIVRGQMTQPAYVSMQVFAYSATTATVPSAKADFTRFSLTATK